jgi:hypothetical protein
MRRSLGLLKISIHVILDVSLQHLATNVGLGYAKHWPKIRGALTTLRKIFKAARFYEYGRDCANLHWGAESVWKIWLPRQEDSDSYGDAQVADENARENHTGAYRRDETSKSTEDGVQYLVSCMDELDKFLSNMTEWVEVLYIRMRERLGEPAATVSELLEEHRKYEILGRALSNPAYHYIIFMALRRLCTSSGRGLRAYRSPRRKQRCRPQSKHWRKCRK